MAGDYNGICGNDSFADHCVPVHGESYRILSFINQPAGISLSGSSYAAYHAGRYMGVVVSQAAADLITAGIAGILFWKELRGELRGTEHFYSARNPAAKS